MRASRFTSELLGAALAGVALTAFVGGAHAQYDEPRDGPVTHFEEPIPEPATQEPGAPPPPEPEAGSKEADAEARTLFEQGRIAFEEGRYRDSWDYFHRAYRLSRRPKLLYNVGQAADRLRKDEEALKAFRLYLKHVPDAENRQEVEARVRALETQLENESGNVPPPESEGPERMQLPREASADWLAGADTRRIRR